MSTIKQDLIAGFSVFLLALPLCLGIALASHYPPAAGILTAIFGGVLTYFFRGSALTIKGPAAGLIVIVLGSVIELGQGDLVAGYERSLAVGVVAALLQILLALYKKAEWAEIMPPAVIHGMLAAIGVIIIIKQLYVLIGIHPSTTNMISLLTHLPQNLFLANPIILGTGLICLLIAIVWPKLKTVNLIPASLIIVLFAIPVSLYFDMQKFHHYHLFDNDYILSEDYLVHLPSHFIQAIRLPDFSMLMTLTSFKYIILFTLVGSIESLLTVCAIDALTQQSSNLNRDLLGVGTANLACALIGGLPMIAEIVRSKANVDYGAQTAKANLFHGLFMLLAALTLTSYINLIPLSALAAMLIYVGFRLASPRVFIHTWHIGADQLALFLTTFIITIVEDLLLGVICGLILKLILHWFRGNRWADLFKPKIHLSIENNQARIKVAGALTFVSFVRLKHLILQAKSMDKPILLDMTETRFIDHTMLSKIEVIKSQFAADQFIISGDEQLQSVYSHALSIKTVKPK